MPCYSWSNAYLSYSIKPSLISIKFISSFLMRGLVSNGDRHGFLHASTEYACYPSKTYINLTRVNAYGDTRRHISYLHAALKITTTSHTTKLHSNHNLTSLSSRGHTRIQYMHLPAPLKLYISLCIPCFSYMSLWCVL